MEFGEVERAKEALKAEYQDRDWFRGVGIAPAASGFALRLNVDPSSGLTRADLPREYRGLPVDVVFIGTYKPRSAPARAR